MISKEETLIAFKAVNVIIDKNSTDEQKNICKAIISEMKPIQGEVTRPKNIKSELFSDYEGFMVWRIAK